MSSKKSEITSTTAETDKPASDHKTIFGPLGKYAVIAVIMVSTIVTTAIVLDKELGTAEEKLAAFENEVAVANAVDEETTAKIENSETAATIAATATAETSEAQDKTELAEIKTKPVNAPATGGKTADVQADEAKVLVAIETNEATATGKKTVTDSNSKAEQAPDPVQVSSAQTTAKIEAVSTDTKAENSVQERQSQSVAGKQNKQWLTREEAYKLEYKQHLAEMLARSKSFQSKQLDKYKIHQDKRVERLREQIAQQQQMIDTLILRNESRYDLRAADIQRHQAKRDQMLNRI